MFIKRKNYELILSRLATLESQNKARSRETHANADKIHELKHYNNQMSLEVRDEHGDPIMGIGAGARAIQHWTDMRDVVRAMADKIGFELVFQKGVEGRPVVIDASAKAPK